MFKFVNFNQILAQMSTTLKRSSSDLIHFFVVLLLAFFAFTHTGVLLFGAKIESFSEFHQAM